MSGDCAERRIVRSIVEEIALQRSIPAVFLLNAAGEATAWPAHAADGIPRALRPLIATYFSQDPAHRVDLTELVDAGGVQMTVRIVPYHAASGSQYALIVEPFVVRSRRARGSGELTTTS
jgi:hypothetical protein